MGDTSSKYAGPDFSDIAESMASGMATGAIAPMGKALQSRMSKKAGSKGYVPPGRKAKMADKAPKINLRKEYKD
jgi:hypothetical protein